ncbi:MAG: class I SAM-dependent rRNA methyltransferase [Myxococcota bacterium]
MSAGPSSLPTIRLLRPLDRVARLGHPWVYRDALEGALPSPGTLVDLTFKDDFVARGYLDGGPIGVRLLTTLKEPLDLNFFRRRLMAAAELRRTVLPKDTDAFRLVNGEGDRLPGVVCDVYGAYAVLRFDSPGARLLLPKLESSLIQVLREFGVQNLLVRAGRGAGRTLEVRAGTLPEDSISVRECGMTLLVDLVHGQKTGMFLDHRDSRALVRRLSEGGRVLNLYGYTGGFSIAAGLGGAFEVVTVDAAPAAIDLALRAWQLNGLSPKNHQGIAADVPSFLRQAESSREYFDFIIADPPSFAPREAAKDAALEVYAQLHRSCVERLRPGGMYLAASCSSHVDRHAFLETVVEAGRRLSRVLQVLGCWGAAPDHPFLTAFPEGDYLKSILVRPVF